MLEVSITKNNHLVYDYKKISSKNSIKLYNVAILGLVGLDLGKLSGGIVEFSNTVTNGWRVFGINPIIIIGVLGVLIGGMLLSELSKAEEINIGVILKELLWVLVIISPVVIGVILMMSDFKIYI